MTLKKRMNNLYGASLVAQSRICLQCRRLGSIPGSERSLEKRMAVHSSILAWRVSWTQEPGRLQFMGLQRAGHNWATKLNWTELNTGNMNILLANFCAHPFPWGASGKESDCQCRRPKRWEFDPYVRKIPGGGHDNPLQYSCLENPMDRGAWQATVHGVAKSWIWLKRLSTAWHIISLG